MSRISRRSSISALVRRAPGPALSAVAGAPSAPELARRILSESAYQRRMPGGGSEAPWSFSLSLGSLGEVVLVVLLVVGLFLFAQWLLEQRLGRRRRLGGSPAAESPAASAPRSFADLAEVDRLAERGRYGEAVHALLLVAIRRLLEPLPAPPGPSRTSRELLASLPLGPSRRQAFAELVREVELSLFGGRPLDFQEYAKCRRSFDAVLAGGGP